MQQSTTQTQQQIDRVMSARYHIADHREAWGDILPGLEKLVAMHAEQDWDIAGIRALLDKGDVLLLIDDDDPSAFAVVKFDRYPYADDATELFVYLVWHQGGDAIERFQPHLEVFAQLGEAQHMRFYSRRPAFVRVATRMGYQLRGIEYVKELNHVR